MLQIGQMNMKKGASWTTVPNLSPSISGIGTPVFEEILKLNFGLDVWNPIVYACTMPITNFF